MKTSKDLKDFFHELYYIKQKIEYKLDDNTLGSSEREFLESILDSITFLGEDLCGYKEKLEKKVAKLGKIHKFLEHEAKWL